MITILFFPLALILLGLQIWYLRDGAVLKRLFHLALSLGILALLTMVVLRAQKHKELNENDTKKGFILIDRSASCMKDPELVRNTNELLRKIRQSGTDISIAEFSGSCLPPYGKGQAGQGTRLEESLEELSQSLKEDPPDWFWLWSDGGFEKLSHATRFFSQKKYYSALPLREEKKDYGVKSIHGDPVWYTRTESRLDVELFRTSATGASEIDVLCFIDGELKSTGRAHFDQNSTRSRVEFVVSSSHLGQARVEVIIAEGQGGSISENDSMLMEFQVIRDKVRVLRVVGRPNWSSKFLRDYISVREDIDLVDFHILRSMHDDHRADPSKNELALMPFPVEELFVENIDSFDLILWQNFDSQTYPFFKKIYLDNISSFVKKGGGILFLSGTLPWDFSRGVFKELVPVQAKGTEHDVHQGPFKIVDSQHGFFTPRLTQDLEKVSELSLNIFPGALSQNSEVLVSLGKSPLMATRFFGRGRVAQILTDGLWQLEFGAENESVGLYSALMNRLLLWLQKHPDLSKRDFQFEGEVASEQKTHLLFSTPKDRPILVLDNSRGDKKEIILEGRGLRIPLTLPKLSGVYRAYLKGSEEHVQILSVPSLSGEFKPLQERLKSWSDLENRGFIEKEWNSTLPGMDPKDRIRQVRTGAPWHQSWEVALVFLGLMFLHWLMISRNQVKTI